VVYVSTLRYADLHDDGNATETHSITTPCKRWEVTDDQTTLVRSSRLRNDAPQYVFCPFLEINAVLHLALGRLSMCGQVPGNASYQKPITDRLLLLRCLILRNLEDCTGIVRDLHGVIMYFIEGPALRGCSPVSQIRAKIPVNKNYCAGSAYWLASIAYLKQLCCCLAPFHHLRNVGCVLRIIVCIRHEWTSVMWWAVYSSRVDNVT
jgi:hypothetical protein